MALKSLFRPIYQSYYAILCDKDDNIGLYYLHIRLLISPEIDR